MCRFAVAEGKLRMPAVAEGRLFLFFDIAVFFFSHRVCLANDQ